MKKCRCVGRLGVGPVMRCGPRSGWTSGLRQRESSGLWACCEKRCLLSSSIPVWAISSGKEEAGLLRESEG